MNRCRPSRDRVSMKNLWHTQSMFHSHRNGKNNTAFRMYQSRAAVDQAAAIFWQSFTNRNPKPFDDVRMTTAIKMCIRHGIPQCKNRSVRSY